MGRASFIKPENRLYAGCFFIGQLISVSRFMILHAINTGFDNDSNCFMEKMRIFYKTEKIPSYCPHGRMIGLQPPRTHDNRKVILSQAFL